MQEEQEIVGIARPPLRALIVANGTLPSEHLVRSEAEAADYVLAADGGANALRGLNIECHAVLGDFDSLVNPLPTVERIPAPDQDYTDLDKAIAHLIAIGYPDIVMIGVTGGRLDHTYGALEMLVKYGRRARLRLKDDIACACLVTDELTLTTKHGQTVSLLPIGPVRSVTTQGLQWELRGEPLAPGVRDGISNTATGDSVTITASGGDLVVYLHRPQGSSGSPPTS